MKTIYPKYCNNSYILVILITILFLPIKGISSPADMESKRQEIDSLLKVLPTSQNTDRVDIFFRLSSIYLSISMDSSNEYARLALKGAKSINDNQKIAEAYKLLGNISYYKGNYNNVVSFYDSSLIEYGLAKDSFGQAKVLNNLGIIYHNIGDFRKAISYYTKSLEYKTRLGDSLGIANTLNNIGSIHYDLAEFGKSYEYFYKANVIYEQLGNYEATQAVLNNMGLISQELGQHQKAVEFFNKSLEVGEITDDVMSIANAYHNLGKSKVMLGKYLEGLELYNKALDLYKSLGASLTSTFTNIGQAYIELDYYYQALEFLNEALESAQENNQFNLLKDIYQNLAVAHERLGKFEEAYYNYMLFNQYDDSIKNQSHVNKIQEISNLHEVEKSQEQVEKARLELDKKQAEIKRRNFAIYSTVAGLIAALIFAFIVFRMAKLRKKANTKLIIQNEEVLRSQEIIKKINKALTENEEKLRSIFDVSPYSIFVLDADNKIVDSNDTSIQLFKATSKHDLLDKQIENFLEDSENSKSNIQDLILSDGQHTEQYNLKRIDLTTFPAEITGRVIRNSVGQIDAYVVVINDITERMNFVENLKDAKSKAEESDRLKTSFLANMSHEIRTPMNSIVGFSNLLNDPSLVDEKKKEFLAHILQSSNLLLNLIDDIIDISKIEAGQLKINPKKFKINEVVREMFNSFKEANSKSEIDYRLHIPPESDEILCNADPIRLKQILSNLLSNAAKFTHKGSIELGYEIDERKSKPTLTFYLRDTGIGIEESKQELIFERFRQVDDSQSRKYGGTGLGLAITRRLVDLLGGSVWVQSDLGKGATFFFTMPFLLEDNQKTEVEKQIEPLRFNWENKTVLIAEDEDSNYELIKAAITNTGVNIIRAVNGEEAVNEIKSGSLVNLILMDIRMPKLNGYDATRQIKKINPGIPIISITAYAMSEDEAKSVQAGCDLYISKPIRPVKLLETINDFL